VQPCSRPPVWRCVCAGVGTPCPMTPWAALPDRFVIPLSILPPRQGRLTCPLTGARPGGGGAFVRASSQVRGHWPQKSGHLPARSTSVRGCMGMAQSAYPCRATVATSSRRRAPADGLTCNDRKAPPSSRPAQRREVADNGAIRGGSRHLHTSASGLAPPMRRPRLPAVGRAGLGLRSRRREARRYQVVTHDAERR